MDKTLLILNIDFTTGLITNSSSEVFIADTDKTIEEVATLLELLLEYYNEANDTGYNFENVFGKIGNPTDEDLEYLAGYLFNDGPRSYNYEDWDEYNIAYSEWLRIKVSFMKTHYGNKIFIYSASDNTIPFDFIDVIERLLNVQRIIHLG